MSILINQNKCIGCGKCTVVCPGNLVHLTKDNKAKISNIKDCWGCCSCLKECLVGALKLFLGADVGGQGYTLYAKDKGDISDWIIEENETPKAKITLNKKDANKY
ncbi:MAG: hypothetical protein K0R90_824 [Oscillospiraceae bacterium]|jgi:adenylylsulfate reductase subunit B|nr:hypothetical protein [Oscillospiraceae bacterium]